MQCAEFNGRDVGIHGVPKDAKWVPKYSGSNKFYNNLLIQKNFFSKFK